jgi:hypothetical protein
MFLVSWCLSSSWLGVSARCGCSSLCLEKHLKSQQKGVLQVLPLLSLCGMIRISSMRRATVVWGVSKVRLLRFLPGEPPVPAERCVVEAEVLLTVCQCLSIGCVSADT